MRGMYTDAILAAIAKRPGIRAVEIADQVDCEIEAVERSIREEIDAGNVRREIVTAPNGRPTCAFWMKGTNSVAVSPPATAVAKEAPAPAPAPRAAVAISPPPLAPATRTKVDILMDYVRQKADQSATDDELRKLIGLSKDQYPSTFLSTQRRNGEIHKDGNIWRLGPRTDGGEEKPVRKAPARQAPMAPAIDLDAEFRCALWSDGELQLARGEQIAMRLSAAEVAHLCNYLSTSRTAA